MGNPPSGAAGGYGFFDAAALWAAPRLVERLRGVGSRSAAVTNPVNYNTVN